jgi:hypothetical protein
MPLSYKGFGQVAVGAGNHFFILSAAQFGKFDISKILDIVPF